MRNAARDEGQTIGLYIVALTAVFFLAFAYFAVGQAAVARNTTQTAADAAALAAAREARDQMQATLLSALEARDLRGLVAVLAGSPEDVRGPCSKANAFARDNDAEVDDCDLAPGSAFGFTVKVTSRSSVGRSVIKGSDNIHPTAEATAIVEPQCAAEEFAGPVAHLTCDGDQVAVDPTEDGFTLDLSMFFRVHLSK